VGSFVLSDNSVKNGESFDENEVSAYHISEVSLQNTNQIKNVSSLLSFKFRNVHGTNMTRFTVLEAQKLIDEIHYCNTLKSSDFCFTMIGLSGEKKSINVPNAVVEQLNQVMSINSCEFE
jgi:hypothetical protein